MRILLTNDDGINAPGINVLADFLEKKNHQLTVVAPDVEKSASSHSITLSHPLRIVELQLNRYAINGSPADCVILALQIVMREKYDVVISGINRGPNLGEDVLYSGTVAAAIEAMYFGLPAIAISLCSKTADYYHTAAHYLSEMLDNDIASIIPKGEILNINVPAIAKQEIKGIKITKTGNRKYKNFVFEQKDPRGRTVYWLGGDKPQWLNQNDTDIAAIENNHISITPIAPNFTCHQSMPSLKKWLIKNDNQDNW